MPPATYDPRAGNTPYQVIAQDPGAYDTTIDSKASNATRAKLEAEHMELRNEYLISQAVQTMVKNQLQKALPPNLLKEIEDEVNVCNSCEPHIVKGIF